jgi:hypothetical protein
MSEHQINSDFTAYIVMFVMVASMMYGKYLIGRGNKDEKISKNKSKENTK